jgi:hypothetical protein
VVPVAAPFPVLEEGDDAFFSSQLLCDICPASIKAPPSFLAAARLPAAPLLPPDHAGIFAPYEESAFGSAASEAPTLSDSPLPPVSRSDNAQKKERRKAMKGDPCWEVPVDLPECEVEGLLAAKIDFMKKRPPFRAGNLRLIEWKKLFQVSQLVIMWLTFGFAAPFPEDFSGFQPQRSFGAVESAFLAEEIEQLLFCGAIVQVAASFLALVSPLHLVPKKGSKPFRTIHDISVGNTVLPDAPFRMETLKDVQEICGKGYFCATIDYSSAFWNVRVSPRTSKYLGFAWAGRLFTWVCLPFGLKTSPFVFSFVSLQVVKQLRSEGILVVFYQDDLFLCHPTKAGCELSVLRALSLLDRLNVRVSWDKSSLLPSQRVIYLGLWVDAFKGCFEVPAAKVLVAKELIAQALKNSSIPVRDLARIAGMLQAMSLALPLVHSALASSYRLIAQSGSWSSDLLLSPDVLSDFHLILLFLDSWNGVASWRSTREVVVIGSDGSPHRSGAWKADLVGGPTLLHSLAWSELDKPRSQNWHELQSAYRALLAFSKFISHTRVFLFLDSRTAICYCLNGGGVCACAC